MLKLKKIFLLSLGLLSAVSLTAQASPTDSPRVIVAPKCLIKNLTAAHKTLSTNKELVMIETNDAGVDQLIEAKHDRKQMCGGFMDVTQDWDALNLKTKAKSSDYQTFLSNYDKPAPLSKNKAEYSINYPKEVTGLLNEINSQAMWSNLGTLTTQFRNRYSKVESGEKAAEWIKENILATAKKYGHTDCPDHDFTVYTINTGTSYRQPSVVAKFGKGKGPGIVIGAHIDTIQGRDGLAPGADDDGSGSVTLFEAARTLLASGMHFEKPIYFIWYAAEEVGLIGSAVVVKQFIQEEIPIEAVMQLDLTGYAHKNETTMWLMSDYTNKDLTTYLEKLITTYVKREVKYSKCGYACSDHANWHRYGFATSLPAEAAMENTNRYIHSVNDTMDKLSLNHMTDYAKLAVAFAVELAKPVKA